MAQTQVPAVQIKDGSIKDVDIAADAAIDFSKLANIDHDALLNYYTKNHADIEGTVQITGLWQFLGSGLGGFDEFDIEIGNGDGYGMLRIGDAVFGRTSRDSANLDLDGTVVLINRDTPPTSNILFAMMDGANSMRFALPKSGVGNATYNPRSMLIAGPAPNDDECVTVSYWQTQGIFHNLVMDTSGSGADLGVQNDLEVEGDIFADSILESTTNAGVTIDGLLIKDGAIPASGVPNGSDGTAIHDNVSSEILGIAAKTSLEGADIFLIEDDGDAYDKKRVTFANLESSLDHDSLSGFVTNEHLDWTVDVTAKVIADENISSDSVTQHEGDIGHNALADYVIGQHRVINDGGESDPSNELYSITKINALVDAKADTSHVHVVVVPHYINVAGSIAVPSGDTDFINPFHVPVPAGQTVKLLSCRYKINNGLATATFKLQKNGSDISGYTSMGAQIATVTRDSADVTISDDDRIAVVVTGISGSPKNLSITLYVEYTI